jgi:PKD repeat protein
MRPKILLVFLLFSLAFSGFLGAQSPSLVFPKNNYVSADSTILFEWDPIPAATSYQLQVSPDSLFVTSLHDINNLLINNHLIALNFGQTLFWRVRGNTNSGPGSWSVAFNLTIFKPAMISGLALWLEPGGLMIHPGSGKVNAWQDASGFSRHAKQNDTALMPEYNPNAISVFGSVLYDGNNDYLKIDSPLVYRHIFAISNWTGPTTIFPNYNGLVSRASSTLPNYILVGRQGYSDFVGFAGQSVFESNLRRNGSSSTSYSPLADWKMNSGSSVNGSLIDQSVLGSYRLLSSRYWQGNMAELIVYSSAISTNQRDLVEAYLRFKYAGPPVNLGSNRTIDYGFCNKTLDAGPGYKSYLWSNGDTTRISDIDSSGLYWVQVNDIFGFPSRDSVWITLNVPQVSIDDTTLCLGDSSHYSLPFNTAIYDILWSDNSTGNNLQTPVPGSWWVRVSDSLNCFTTDTFQIFADSFPIIPSLGPDLSLCDGNQIALIQGSSLVQSYHWSTLDTTASITINSSGTYSLTVTNAGGCSSTDSIYVSIKGFAPGMNFLSDSACLGTPTHLTDSSYTPAPDSLSSWTWDFGDGNSGFGQTVQHTFAQAGIHLVRLTVTTDSACFNSIQKPVFVYPRPNAAFSPYSACQLSPVHFLDSSDAPFSSIAHWDWDFGDPGSGGANISSLQNPEHTYQQEGNNLVRLTITTSAGCLDTAEAIVLVKPSPLPNFSIGPSCEKGSTSFTDLSSTLPGNPISLRRWDFGDGSLSSLQSPLHVYQTAGPYPISLYLQSINGCTGTHTDTLHVAPLPDALFPQAHGCRFVPLQLDNQSTVPTGGIQSFQWSYQGNIFSNDSLPYFPAIDTGIYQVNLLVVSDMGCRDSASNLITIHPFPEAGFTLSPEYGVPPHEIATVNNSQGASLFQWHFGDGNSSQQFEPIHTYTDSGYYEVVLIATNDWGCADTGRQMVYVLNSWVDLRLSNLDYQIDNGVIRISLALTNLGSRIIRGIDLKAWLPEGLPILEYNPDTLVPGETTYYAFRTGFVSPEGSVPGYICVEAKASSLPEDVNPDDNTSCLVSGQECRISRLYPNPAGDQLFIELIVPGQDPIKLELIDSWGRVLTSLIDESLPSGRQLIDLNTYGLPDGFYILRLRYREQQITRTFIIQH